MMTRPDGHAVILAELQKLVPFVMSAATMADLPSIVTREPITVIVSLAYIFKSARRFVAFHSSRYAPVKLYMFM